MYTYSNLDRGFRDFLLWFTISIVIEIHLCFAFHHVDRQSSSSGYIPQLYVNFVSCNVSIERYGVLGFW